jgi:L-lactate permease
MNSALVLLAAFMVPVLLFFRLLVRFRANGLYEALCVLLVFPAIIMAGAHSDAGVGLMSLCKASGRLSIRFT